MKTQTKTILLLFTLMGIFLLFFVGAQYLRTKDLNLFLKEKFASDTMVIHSVLQFQTESFMNPTLDNSSWDEMASFTKSKDMRWAAENFIAVRSNYDMSFLGAFDTTGNLLYGVTDSNSVGFMLTNTEIESMFLQSKTNCCFKLYNGIVYEIFGAAIVPTFDTRRQSPPQGFLISGKQWNPDYIKELEKATGSVVNIFPINSSSKTTVKNENIERNLMNIHCEPIATLVFEKTNNLQSERKASNTTVIIGTIFYLIAILLFFFLTRKWLTLPLKKVLKSLTTGNSEVPTYLLHDLNEFEEIELLIIKFHEQRGRLHKELNEKIKSEEKIKKLSTAVEQSANSIVITDKEGNIEYVNPFFTDLTGYTFEEAVGKNPRILKTDFKDDDYYKNLWKTITSGNEWKGEFYNKKKNGENYWESASITPIRNTTGEITHFVAIKEDITARKNAERSMQEAKEFAELIYTVTPSAIYTVDSERYITSWNKKASLITGYSAEDIIGKKCSTFSEGPCKLSCGLFNPDVPKPINAKECTIIHKNGKRLVISKNVDILKDVHGNIIGGIESFEDITKQKKAEKNLKDSEQRYSTLVHQLPDSVLIHRNGEILFVNNAALQIFGYKAYELIGMDLFKFIGEESREKYMLKYSADVQYQATIHCPNHYKPFLFKNEKTFEEQPLNGDFEIKVKTKSGNLRNVIMKTDTIVFDGEAAFVSILMDITERTNAEIVLRNAKNEADKANQAKSDFLATMSHEIRTPLNGVIGLTDLALTTKLTHSQRDYLESIHISAYLLLDTINDILDFSKIEAGKLELESIEFNLREVIEKSVDILTVKAFDKKLELLCEIDPVLPEYFMGDPLRVRQILVNLIGNAIKFTEKGEIFVSVKPVVGTNNRENNSNIRFSISDTGIGIQESRKAHIFNSFTQADSSTSRKYGGSGLGLAISKNLTGLMKGTMHVESEYGKGSTFSFELPLQIAKPHVDMAHEKPLEIKKVLVVDDNLTNLRIMKDMLNYWDITTVLSSDGLDALDVLSHANESGNLFDLVILDMHMPEMDGLSLAKKIREELELSKKPLIMMFSSLEKELLRSNGELSGIDQFLTKPVKMSDLLEVMQHLGNKDFPIGISPSRKVVTLPAINPQKTVLIAEDNSINIKLLAAMLKMSGVKVHIARDGEEAISVFNREKIDLIFMDMHMPGTDGFQAINAIRKIEEGIIHTPIIALTALAMQGDKEKCVKSGADDYLSKPYKKEQLFTMLEKYLGKGDSAILNTETKETDEHESSMIFNKEELIIMTGNDTTLYKEILGDYKVLFPDLFEKLKQAIHNSDFTRTEYFSHTMKGMSGNIRALEIRNICEEIEDNAVSLQSFEEIALMASRLEKAYNSLLLVIESELA